MPQYKASKIKNARRIGALNENRQGSLLDFIDDFTNRFVSTWRNTTRC